MIGLAVGQLVTGPISDRVGRRRPLIIGLIAYVLLSASCAFIPSLGVLIAVRFLVGVAGGAGIVISRAIVRDSFTGRDISRMFSLLMVISSTAPIVAPVLGGALLQVVDWRGLFIVMALLGAVVLVVSVLVLPETHVEASRPGSDGPTLAEGMRRVFADPLFVASTLVLTISGAGIFTYISSSSFVFQGEFGLTPQQFSWVFGANSVGSVSVGFLNSRLVKRVAPRTLLTIGGSVAAAGIVTCLTASILGLPLPVILVALFATVASTAMVSPNATALGMLRQGRQAGSASGVIGSGSFIVGAALAPIASIGGASAVAMTLIMAVLLAGSLAVIVFWIRPMRSITDTMEAEAAAAEI